jgi:hypothetical protein
VSHFVQADAATDLKAVDPEKEQARKAELMEKVQSMKASMERKRQAREKYEAYMKEHTASMGTDYEKWDLWCPEDEEDDLIASCTPHNSQLKAMEKDINERHQRCVQRMWAARGNPSGTQHNPAVMVHVLWARSH